MAASTLLAAFSFALTLIFIPTISGAATAPRWAFLAILVPIYWTLRDERARWTLGHALGLMVLGWAGLSLLWTPQPLYEGLEGYLRLLLLAGLFSIGVSLESLKPVYVGLALGMTVNSAIAVMQAFGWDGIPQAVSPAGLFLNKNYLAEPAALVLIALIGHRMWAFIPGVLPSLILPMHRGSMLALAAVATYWVWTKSRLLALVLMAFMVLGAVTFLARDRGDGVAYWTNDSFSGRWQIWSDTVDGMTWLGNGVGSFYIRYASHATHFDLMKSRPVHAHNDYLEAAYELGPGIIPLIGLLAFCFMGHLGPERFVFLGFLAQAGTNFPTYFPVTGALAGLLAGYLCRDRSLLRYHVAVWRMALRAGLGYGQQSARGLAAYARRACGIPAQSNLPHG